MPGRDQAARQSLSSADVPPQTDANFLRRHVLEARAGGYSHRERVGDGAGVGVAEVEEAVADIEVEAAGLTINGAVLDADGRGRTAVDAEAEAGHQGARCCPLAVA